MIQFIDTPDRRVTLALAAGALTLDSRGPTLHFDGEWALRGDDGLCVFGRCSRGAGWAVQRASLLVEAQAEAEPGVRVTLKAADGRVVVGPVRLQPTVDGTGRVTAAHTR